MCAAPVGARSFASLRINLIVANDVADSSIGFDSDQNEVLVLARDGSVTKIDRAPKIVVANRILDLVVANLS
jgi:phosphopantothenoylcysteine decarboxylase/phosphopantothenate--cysteine ligase